MVSTWRLLMKIWLVMHFFKCAFKYSCLFNMWSVSRCTVMQMYGYLGQLSTFHGAPCNMVDPYNSHLVRHIVSQHYTFGISENCILSCQQMLAPWHALLFSLTVIVVCPDLIVCYYASSCISSNFHMMLSINNPSFSGQTIGGPTVHRLLSSAVFARNHLNWTGIYAYSVGYQLHIDMTSLE